MRQILTTVWRYFYRLTLLTGIGALLTGSTYYVYDKNFSEEAFIKHIHEMYREIGLKSGQRFPPLKIDDSDNINAYATSEMIVLHRGIIDFTKNDHELAMIIGHEMAHYYLHHVHFDPPIQGLDKVVYDKQAELNSDKLGAFIAMQAGYDVCKGREVWRRFGDEYGDIIENLSHPLSVFRHKNLEMPWCEGGV